MARSIRKAMFWKLLERFGSLGIQFLLQVILARLLDPALYGTLSLMVIFTTIANVFVQNGFNTSLIQAKEVEEDDYSSVFWTSLGIAALLYLLLYAGAPALERFFGISGFATPFRVLALMLFPGAYNSIQVAKARRTLDFRKIFYSSIAGMVLSGCVSITMAYFGAGLWALVAQSLIQIVVSCIVMAITIRWRLRLTIRPERVKMFFSYGWKLLLSSLLETVYEELRGIAIGKKYTEDMLAFFNRGKQFPQFVISAINSTVQAVMLPAMAQKQDEKEKVKALMRKSIMLTSFLIFPLVAGLAAVATPLVKLLLTDKWLPCVPYLQIYCFIYAFYPVHSCNLQAINAMGRSDIYLKLEVIKKGIGVLSLVIALVFFDSPVAIAMTGAVTAMISCFINAYPNKKLIGYSYFEQLKDILPAMVSALLMGGIVLAVGKLPLATPLLLTVQVLTGVVLYAAIAFFARLPAFTLFRKMLRESLHAGAQNTKRKADAEI